MDTTFQTHTDTRTLKANINNMINVINQIELSNQAAIKSKEALEKTINQIMDENKNNKEALDIATHAIEILRKVSDEAVGKAYGFLEKSLNSALEKMFKNTTRKIEIREDTRGGQYPQLELRLHVGNGKIRSLKSGSGHGIAQIVSIMSILALIVITGSRRILVMDEIISGVSVENRKILNDILWSFTEIGFQFIVNDHGFVPQGSNVYHLEMVGDTSSVKQNYIAKQGVYLQGNPDEVYNYAEKPNLIPEDDTIEEIREIFDTPIEGKTPIIKTENNNTTTENSVVELESEFMSL